MQKDPKSQVDDDFEKLFRQYIDDLMDDDTANEKNTEASLPFPKEMDDEVADVKMKSDREKRNFREMIAKVEVDVTACREGDYYGFCPLTVSLKANRGIHLPQHRFKCFVYGKDLFPMCNSEDSVEIERGRGNRLLMEIPCTHIWIPGEYMLLILDSADQSVVRIDFRLDEHLNATCEEPEDRGSFDVLETLVTLIQTKDSEWDSFAVLPGMAQLRRRIAENRHLKFFSSYRQEFNGGPFSPTENLLIQTCNADLTTDVLQSFLRLGFKDLKFLPVDCATLYDTTRNNPYEVIPEVLCDVSSGAVCLMNLSELLAPSGKVVVRKFLTKMREKKGEMRLWLVGSKQEIDSLLELYPSLKAYFRKDSLIRQEPYTAFELVQAFFSELQDEYLNPDSILADFLSRQIILGHERGVLANWSVADVRRFIIEEVRPAYLRRAMPLALDSPVEQLSAEDVDFEKLTTKVSEFDTVMQELNGMVGLEGVKQGIRMMTNQARLFQERRRRGLRTSNEMIFHTIFTGNPGTGKTTVARKLGRLFHSLGLLSKGDVIAVDRTRLVGQYIGQTEDNMKVVLEEARGNVLFIDEAYTLSVGGDDKKDFGGRVLDSLLTVLTQPNPDMLIIFAGYTKEMNAMLNSNPGLAGRFPYRYQFEDYTADQLMDIALHLFEADEYLLDQEAIGALREAVSQTVAARLANFSNARWVEQFVRNGIIPAMADRIFSTGSSDLQHIEAADITTAFEKFNPKILDLKPGRHHVAGFRA